jgi:hypothetical protein
LKTHQHAAGRRAAQLAFAATLAGVQEKAA